MHVLLSSLCIGTASLYCIVLHCIALHCTANLKVAETPEHMEIVWFDWPDLLGLSR